MKKLFTLVLMLTSVLLAQARNTVELRSGNPNVLLQSGTASFEVDWDNAHVTNWDNLVWPQYLQKRGDDFVRDWPQDRIKAESYFTIRFNKKSNYWRLESQNTSAQFRMILRITTIDVGNGGANFSPFSSVKAGGVIINGVIELRDAAGTLLCVLSVNDVKGVGHMSETTRYGMSLFALANEVLDFMKDVKKGKITPTPVEADPNAGGVLIPTVITQPATAAPTTQDATPSSANPTVQSGETTEATVKLKNGSVINGKVKAFDPTTSITIEVAGIETAIPMSEVENVETRKVTSQQVTRPAQQQNIPQQQYVQPTYGTPVASSSSSNSDKYDHGHRGLDVTFQGGVLTGEGGASGEGGIELGKRFSKNFYWGFLGGGVMGGSGDLMVSITETFKGLFPVTRSGIAPNVVLRPGFLYNTEHDYHSVLVSILPGIQIPLGQKVDINVNLGYALTIGVGKASGTGHGFMATLGFGFHKPWDRNR